MPNVEVRTAEHNGLTHISAPARHPKQHQFHKLKWKESFTWLGVFFSSALP